MLRNERNRTVKTAGDAAFRTTFVIEHQRLRTNGHRTVITRFHGINVADHALALRVTVGNRLLLAVERDSFQRTVNHRTRHHVLHQVERHTEMVATLQQRKLTVERKRQHGSPAFRHSRSDRLSCLRLRISTQRVQIDFRHTCLTTLQIERHFLQRRRIEVAFRIQAETDDVGIDRNRSGRQYLCA